MPTIFERNNFELELGFTRIYKENLNRHKAIREAKCLEWQLPRILLDIENDDLVPGGCHYGAVGFSSQIGGFLYYCHKEKIELEIKENIGNDAYIKELEEMICFWENENSKSKLRKTYSKKQLLALPTDDWENEKAITYPLYRIAGAILEFDKLLSLGINELKKEIEDKQKLVESQNDSYYLFEGMKMALDTLINVIEIYENRANEKAIIASQNNDVDTETRMIKLKNALNKIKKSKPKHFLEAVELFWMYVLVSEVRNYGRIDTYLSNFYVKDIESGYISEEEGEMIVQKLWERMGKRKTITDGRVFVGGKGRKNEKNADIFAKACIRATKKLKNPDPQLSLRFYKGMNQELMDLSIDAIGEGCTYPILYNDDVIIKDVQNAFNLPENIAVQYVPYGCGEYIINHKSFGTPSGVINLLKALEVFMNYEVKEDEESTNGINNKILAKIKEEINVGKKFAEYNSFEEFYSDFKKFLKFHIEIIAEQEKMEYDFTGNVCCLPYLSMLYDDCIEIGQSIFDGGIEYLGGTLESYGDVNTADSLYAIKKLLFDENSIRKEELVNALDNNFVGYELIQKKLKMCDKFGNDIDEVDELMSNLHNFVCEVAKEQSSRVGLHSYLVVVINNSANTSLGLLTGASADGRYAYTSMANANSPQACADKNGVTAVLNSMLKIDSSICAGMVQNIKFSTETFRKNRKEVESILKAYFCSGGAQLMVTVVGKDELEEAMLNPEKYQNLLVRVGGFSAKFVELPKEVQIDILNRTCY